MKNVVNVVAITLGMASLAACGQQAESGGGGVDPGASVLHEFEVGGLKYEVIDVGGSVVLGVQGRADVAIPHFISSDDGSQPSILEMYRALQPDGSPSERLFEAHADTATAQERVDASVRDFSLDLSAPIEKHHADCINLTLGFGSEVGCIGTLNRNFYTKGAEPNASNTGMTSSPGSQYASATRRKGVAISECNFASNAVGDWFDVQLKTGQFGGSFVSQETRWLNAGEAYTVLSPNDGTWKNWKIVLASPHSTHAMGACGAL